MDKNKALIALSGSEKTQYGIEEFDKQSFPQKVFSAIWALEAEVNNGGFRLYFLNSSSETAWFVLQALEAIDAPKTADICKRAINAAFPKGLPSDIEEISKAAASFPQTVIKELDSLDQEFFSYPNDLTELLYQFVLKHPDEFGTPPFSERTWLDELSEKPPSTTKWEWLN
jgi:hypothetical protein